MTSPGILHFFPHMLRWASACHLRGVERGVAQIGAFYSNGCILKGSVNERKGISLPTHPLSATLASTSHSRQKNTATLTCRKEVTVSGTLEKFGQCWQRSVLCLQSTVCQLFFSFFFFLLQTAHTHPDTPHMFICLTCHLFSCSLVPVAVLTLMRRCLYCFTHG